MGDLPDIYEHVFIRDGDLCGVKRDFSKLFMKGKTGILILKPVEFFTKTAYKATFPERKKDLECMDPNRNVASHKQPEVERREWYGVYNDNDPVPRSPTTFDELEDALQYIEQHKDEGKFSLRYPDGRWHKWDE